MIKYLFNPAELINEKFSALSLAGFLLSGPAFALFFLQTAIDSGSSVFFGLFKGVLFGTLGIAFAGILIWLIVKIAGSNSGLMSVMGAIALSYTSTLIFTIVGLFLHFSLGWNTALSCGITGVLSAFGPMSGVISAITNGRKTLNIFILTLTGLYIIFFWAILT
ncbi:MAG: hypothetical protein NTV87_18065 [Ignavibacteriae bacterium]|nr:hypothetical protein [Ignavibacteriota bacterium]